MSDLDRLLLVAHWLVIAGCVATGWLLGELAKPPIRRGLYAIALLVCEYNEHLGRIERQRVTERRNAR